ncbi:hypothetical protein D3C71_1880290 [compost metagenome]
MLVILLALRRLLAHEDEGKLHPVGDQRGPGHAGPLGGGDGVQFAVADLLFDHPQREVEHLVAHRGVGEQPPPFQMDRADQPRSVAAEMVRIVSDAAGFDQMAGHADGPFA